MQACEELDQIEGLTAEISFRTISSSE